MCSCCARSCIGSVVTAACYQLSPHNKEVPERRGAPKGTNPEHTAPPPHIAPAGTGCARITPSPRGTANHGRATPTTPHTAATAATAAARHSARFSGTLTVFLLCRPLPHRPPPCLQRLLGPLRVKMEKVNCRGAGVFHGWRQRASRSPPHTIPSDVVTTPDPLVCSTRPWAA